MKDVTRMPTTLQRLQELAGRQEDRASDYQFGDKEYEPDTAVATIEDDIAAWLNWALAHLENRKQYHRKRALKLSLMQKMAETLLSEDELAAIDDEAEKQLVEQEDKNG